MKAIKALPLLIFAGIVGCSDHQNHVAESHAAEEATTQPAKTASKPQMSMVATDARIAKLAGKATDCNIESVNQKLFEPSTPTIAVADGAKVTGWLVDTTQKVVPSHVLIRVENEAGDKAWEQAVANWGDRGDIVSANGGVQAYQKSGFDVQLELGDLPAGNYNVYLAYDSNGAQVGCGVGRRFTVK